MRGKCGCLHPGQLGKNLGKHVFEPYGHAVYLQALESVQIVFHERGEGNHCSQGLELRKLFNFSRLIPYDITEVLC